MSHERYHHLDDGTLVQLAQMGRLEPYDALVSRYRSAVATIARSHISSRECAEDAVQETLLKAFRHIRVLSDPDKFGGWLYAIARQTCVNWARREVVERSLLQRAIDHAVLESSTAIRKPEDLAIQRLSAGCASDALQSLPLDLAAPIALQIEEGWSLAEIAEFLSLPVSTIKWRMHEGRRKLRSMLPEGEHP